jgi:hypothetical protein
MMTVAFDVQINAVANAPNQPVSDCRRAYTADYYILGDLIGVHQQ